jgi:hypothetical protein
VKLRRWDIVFVHADEKDATGHPGVVLSHEDMLDDPRHHRFNVLIGSKKPPSASAAPRHVILNGADGLEFVTLIDCGLVVVARKASVLRTAKGAATRATGLSCRSV